VVIPFAQVAISPAVIPVISILSAQITAPPAVPPALQHIPQMTIILQAEARIHDLMAKAIIVPGEDTRREATNQVRPIAQAISQILP
jgi:hypothetical protein